MSDVKVCPTCGEPFFVGQRYFSGPKKEHVVCRKFNDVSLELGAALHAKHTLQELLKEQS